MCSQRRLNDADGQTRPQEDDFPLETVSKDPSIRRRPHGQQAGGTWNFFECQNLVLLHLETKLVEAGHSQLVALLPPF